MAGRPSDFSDEIAAEICERLSDGESLNAICASEGMPHRETERRWRRVNQDYAAKCARARVDALDSFEDRMMEVAESAVDKDTAACAKVQISTLQWIASKRDPRRYGDKTQLEVGGIGGAPIATVTLSPTDPIEAAKLYQRLMSGG